MFLRHVRREIPRTDSVLTREEHSWLRLCARRMVRHWRRSRDRCRQEIVIAARTTDRDEAVGPASPWIRAPSRYDALARLRYHLVAENTLCPSKERGTFISSNLRTFCASVSLPRDCSQSSKRRKKGGLRVFNIGAKGRVVVELAH